jgi:hypothetical protein
MCLLAFGEGLLDGIEVGAIRGYDAPPKLPTNYLAPRIEINQSMLSHVLQLRRRPPAPSPEGCSQLSLGVCLIPTVRQLFWNGFCLKQSVR